MQIQQQQKCLVLGDVTKVHGVKTGFVLLRSVHFFFCKIYVEIGLQSVHRVLLQ